MHADGSFGRRADEYVLECLMTMRADDQNLGHVDAFGIDDASGSIIVDDMDKRNSSAEFLCQESRAALRPAPYIQGLEGTHLSDCARKGVIAKALLPQSC